MPSPTWLDRSPTPCETWLLTKVTSSAMKPMPTMTTSSAASLRGMPSCCPQVTSGVASAAISSAITTGSTTTRNRLSSHSTIAPAPQTTMKRHDHAAARSMP